MARDIEEFLRRAAERRKQNQQGGGKPPAQPPRQQQPPRRQPPRQQPPRQPPRQTPRLTITEDDIIEAEAVPDSRLRSSIRKGSVKDHVRQHLDSNPITESSTHLAEEVELADDKLRSRLKSTFDHEVGHLDHDTVTDDPTPGIFGKDVPSSLATDLVEMLRSPTGVQRAILANEILKRPDFDAIDKLFDDE